MFESRMKSIHSYFKLKGGKLKTKYHSYTRVRSRFSLSVFFFLGGGLRGGGGGGGFGGGGGGGGWGVVSRKMCRNLVKEAGSINCLDSRNWTERLTFVSVIIREAPKIRKTRRTQIYFFTTVNSPV